LSSLKTKLTSTPLREDSGADTASRYRFQALCGLILVLERHKLDDDYALIFEYHDDIALLDSSIDPSRVAFYQVKSKKTGHWTQAALTKQKKSTKKDSDDFLPSYLGKMYQNVIAFGDDVDSATFLSNAPTNFSPGQNDFCLDECDQGDLEKIVSKLETEFPSETTIRTEILRIGRSDLSLDDADNHARGKFDSFVVEHLGEVEFSTAALFKAVSEECSRKARAKTNPTQFEDVLKDRGITRSDAAGWLATVSEVVDCPKWESIAPKLNLPFMEEVRIGREWRAYRVAVLNPNEAFRRVRRRISKELDTPVCETLGLTELLDHVSDIIGDEVRQELAPINQARIKAMILYETYSKN
jgi:hypothetical protein